MDSAVLAQTLCVAAVAFLYAAVGHGGATGYIAALSLFGVSHEQIAATALILNCVVASISLFAYARAGELKWRLALPYLILSVPCAFLGARVPVSKQVFAWVLSLVLIAASLRFLFLPGQFKAAGKTAVLGAAEARETGENEGAASQSSKAPPLYASVSTGAALGFLSGMVGIGGGVFLSPIMILCGWATVRETAAASALFIVCNSLSGIVGRLTGGNFALYNLVPFLGSAIVAAMLGSALGARYFSSNALRRLLAVVLLIAAIRLLSVH